VLGKDGQLDVVWTERNGTESEQIDIFGSQLRKEFVALRGSFSTLV
jgi:hypothetical protein